VLVLFALVMTRVAGMFIGAPLFSREGVPWRFRFLLICALALALLPALRPGELPVDAAAVAGALIGELSIGLCIGLLARFFLTAFQLAGDIASFQMGFALAQSFDPESSESTPVIATIHLGLVTLLFLLLDGHHMLIRSVAVSFTTLPPGSTLESGALTESLFSAAGRMFEIGARVAAPTSGVLLLINGMVGFLNRVTPQLSIFNIGFPMTVIGGLLVVGVSLPGVANCFTEGYVALQGEIAVLVGG